jgi:geranylgeranyl pyrophosphate synthase
MTDFLQDYLQDSQARINGALDSCLQNSRSEFSDTDTRDGTGKLWQAIRYSCLPGGKRVRPVLVYAAADAVKVDPELAPDVDKVAVAVECIHAYSLVHDDLPVMDDDALRRGQPTCHISFDEATAVLAGDALQAIAFEQLIAADGLSPKQRLALAKTLAAAAGARGMVGGQAIDLGAVDQQLNLQQLESMHQLKTGALIRASVRMGALCGNADQARLEELDRYAHSVGLAFQILDDILDVESDTSTLGKQQGADARLNKPTYPALLGLDKAKEHARQRYEEALEALSNFGEEARILRELAHYIVKRRH